MNAVFLSASVPVVGRGSYHETANPFLIQTAVRELVIAVIGQHRLVWGGHPAITPMIWTICRDLSVEYSQSVVLYQSRFFEDRFPEENAHFRNAVFVDAVAGDRDASLRRLREVMISRPDLRAAVFVGGMEGLEAEYKLFHQFHPDRKRLILSAPGGAARQLAEHPTPSTTTGHDVDFARFYQHELLPALSD